MAELSERLQQTLGSGYRVIKELGGGGMARVFAAEETELEREVVIKVLPSDLGAGLNVERFRREIQLAAKLQHPHIVPLLSAGAKDGLLYYTMPHIAGDTLRNKLTNSGEMPIPETIRILRDIIDALEYAHEHGVVHRDIKPENVLLSGHHALVTDFGVAKALASSTGQQSLTSVGIAIGTPMYMSPEQASADPSVDHRTDIYAFGVVAYELLAGMPPFIRNSSQRVLAAHLTETPLDIKLHRPNTPPQLATLIMRCLEKKPADRWQTAHEIRLQLEALSTPGSGTQRYPTMATSRSTRTTRFRSAFKTHPSLAWASGVMGIVFLAAIGFAARSLFAGSDFPFTVGTARQITNDAGVEVTPAISPDGKLIAYAGGSTSLTRIYVRQVAGGEPVEIAASLSGNQREPQWSPDGSQVIFVGKGGIFGAPALGGAPQLLVRGEDLWGPGRLSSPAWSHDAKSLVFGRDSAIIIADADGRNERRLFSAPRCCHSFVWSADDSHLAYVAGNLPFLRNAVPSAIWTIRRDGRRPHELTKRVDIHLSPAWTSNGQGLLYVSNEHGGRDVYYQHLSRDAAADGAPVRLTTGLNIQGISLSSDGSRLAYSLLTAKVAIWTVPIPSSAVSIASGHPVSQSNERIELLEVSPDKKWIAFDSDRSGKSHIYKIPIAGGQVEQITRGANDEFGPHWSPDGSQITYHMFSNGNRDSYVTPVSSFSPRLVMGGPGQDLGGVWSPDGKQLAVPSTRAGLYDIYLVPVTGGELRRITNVGASHSAWSPDGKWITTVINKTIALVSPVTGDTKRIARKPLSNSPIPGAPLAWSADSRRIFVLAGDGHGHESIDVVDVKESIQRLLVRFDRAELPLYHDSFSTDGRNLYFPIGGEEADIWVMELTRK